MPPVQRVGTLSRSRSISFETQRKAARPNSVIDLTKEYDEDMQTAKAVEASMQSGNVVFGPSTRIDTTGEYAMVPSNASCNLLLMILSDMLIIHKAPPALSQEDQALNQALEASLSSSFIGVSQDIYEEPLDLVARVRKDGWSVLGMILFVLAHMLVRPVAFRTTNGAFCCVPAVMQCVMSIPNVHQRLLRYDVNGPGDEYAHGTSLSAVVDSVLTLA